MTLKKLDITSHEHEEKNKALLDAFNSLDVGEKMILINDYDPTPLLEEINNTQMINHIEWENVVDGPDQWQTTVSKRYMSFI